MSYEILPCDMNAKADVDSGVYELHYQLQPGDVVLDIGAHVGFFTEHALAKIGGNGFILAFEPSPRNFRILEQKFSHFKNVRLVEAACGNSNGSSILWMNHENSGGSSIFRNEQHSGTASIAMVKASEYIEKSPRFVKCDAEDAELLILSDLMTRLDAPVDLAIEIHAEQLYVECKKLLLGHGYEFIDGPSHIGVNYARKV